MPKFTRNFNILARCSAFYRGRAFEELGITANQYAFILRVCAEPGITQDALAKHLFINKSNATRQLTALENSGFIERRQSEDDRRVLLIYPTQKAIDVRPAILEKLVEWNDYLLEGFNEDELQQLDDMMEKILEKAKTYVLDRQ